MSTHAEDRWQEFYWGLSEKRKMQADRNYLAARAQFFLDEQRAAEAHDRLREYQASLISPSDLRSSGSKQSTNFQDIPLR